MPNSKQGPTIPALVVTILEPAREIGDAAKAETEAAQNCCKTIFT
jgi:hypothetical protein